MSIGSSYKNKNDSYGSVRKGQTRESLFMVLCKRCKVPYRNPSAKVDMTQHIDLFITEPASGKEFGVDIKAFKASKRGSIKDRLASVDITKVKPSHLADSRFLNMDSDCPSQEKLVLELQTNSGYPGWLYGKADFIAFEMYRKFRLVPRKELIKVVEATVDMDNIVYYGLTDYYLYQRKKWGHKDLITQIDMFQLDDHKVNYRDWHFDGHIEKPRWKTSS